MTRASSSAARLASTSDRRTDAPERVLGFPDAHADDLGAVGPQGARELVVDPRREDLDGDGQVVIGSEQYITPDCTNPITECANSSWYQWTAGFPTFPGVYDTTNEQTFEPSEYLAGEAVVEEL